MKALIAVAVYDTEENNRTRYTERTLNSLLATTNPATTRIFVIDNASCEATKELLKKYKHHVNIITNKENIGTAEAINLALKEREEGEFCVKCDNDVEIHDNQWTEKLIRCFVKDPMIGILGLKRKDLPNQPGAPDGYGTKMQFIHHNLGDTWDVIEYCQDIIGTCTMFNPKLLDEVGYLYQPSIYGFDDVLMCKRSVIAGYENAFYPSIEIDHIDEGNNPYIEWKKRHAGLYLPKISDIIHKYQSGEVSIYYNPFEE